jgi:hypothetical protein
MGFDQNRETLVLLPVAGEIRIRVDRPVELEQVIREQPLHLTAVGERYVAKGHGHAYDRIGRVP